MGGNKMTKKEIKELNEENKKRLAQWVKDGNKITTYKCQHCEKNIETCQPKKSMVTSKGFWDSATICTNCGKISFVRVYPSGKTESFKLGR